MFELEPVTPSGFNMPIPEEQSEYVTQFAFSRDIAREVKDRADWECEETGRKASDGWRMEACHKNHDKNYPYYNHPDNGNCLCLLAHLEDHITLLERTKPHKRKWAYRSVQLIAKRAYFDGQRTQEHYFNNPLDIIDDREEIVEMLSNYGLKPEEFILW